MAWNSVPNVHLIDQLTEKTYDGKPLDNGPEDCVFCSAAAGTQALDNILVSGDELKDAAKGDNYTGGGNAAWLVPILARAPYYVKLQAVGGTQAQLIGVIREQIKAGHPSIITIPSNWGIAPANPLHPGNSHCVLACGIDDSDSGYMTCMNPWHGFWHREPIAWWRARLCDGAVWPLSKIAAPAPVPTIVDLPHGYKWNAAAGTLTAPDGVVMIGGMAAKKRADILAGIDQTGYPRGPEFITQVDDGPITAENFGSATWVWRAGYPAPRYATDTEMSAMIAYEHSKRAA